MLATVPLNKHAASLFVLLNAAEQRHPQPPAAVQQHCSQVRFDATVCICSLSNVIFCPGLPLFSLPHAFDVVCHAAPRACRAYCVMPSHAIICPSDVHALHRNTTACHVMLCHPMVLPTHALVTVTGLSSRSHAVFSTSASSGGTTMLPGIASRLEKELRTLYLDRQDPPPTPHPCGLVA